MPKKTQYSFSRRTQQAKGSIIREILKLLDHKGLISFAGGLPAPELFPVKRLRIICDYVLKHDGASALQYSITEGLPVLRKALTKHLAGRKMRIPIEQLLVTSGAQQALDLIGKVFLDPGDTVVVGDPTYLGAVQAFNAYQARYVTIPLDDSGMRMDILESRLKKIRPKLIYVIPDFQNPTGRLMPLERRRHLLCLAEKHGIPIVEDDPYGELRFAGKPVPTLKSLDRSGLVIYAGTFSKIISPGMRLGWAAAAPPVMQKLVLAKQAGDLHCGTFVQKVAGRYMEQGFLDEHIGLIRKVYKKRRDIMVRCLREYFPDGSHWVDSEGGLFVWVVLPERFDTTRLLNKAVLRKVAYVPGTPFYANGGGKNTLRLNFSNARPEQIEAGIARLGRIFRVR